MYRTQVRVNVTNQVQMLLSEAAVATGMNRSLYLQRMIAAALHRDLGVDADELLPTPHPQSSVANSKHGGLRERYTAKQPTISFLAMGRVPSLLYRAAQETGLGKSSGAYVRRELRAALARDLKMDPEDILMPKELPDHDHPWTHDSDEAHDRHIEAERQREEWAKYDF